MLKKFTGPGLLRLILAEVVFFHHISRFSVGTAAVYVFFCLSGFWIYRMYTRRYAATRQPYLTFMVSRVWRLLPTFWLTTGIAFLSIALFASGGLKAYWRQAGLLHFVFSNVAIFGYNSLRVRPLVPAWSLDIEMQFYLLAPLMAILLYRRSIHPGVFLLLTVMFSVGSIFLGNPVPLITYLFLFVFGMTAASADWKPSASLALGLLGVAALGIVLLLASPWRADFLIGAHPGALPPYTAHVNLALALLVLPYAIYTTRQSGFAVDAICGDLSYVVYLLHGSGALWLRAHTGAISQQPVDAVVTWILVNAGAVLIWKFYDRPINRRRSRWVNRRKIISSTTTLCTHPPAGSVGRR